jgi:hypothetical protein
MFGQIRNESLPLINDDDDDYDDENDDDDDDDEDNQLFVWSNSSNLMSRLQSIP